MAASVFGGSPTRSRVACVLSLAGLALTAVLARPAGADDPGAAPEPLALTGASSAGARPSPVVAPAGLSSEAVVLARGPELATALAGRLGLGYQDVGSHLLLSDGLCRVRIYPNSHRVSLDGEDRTLRGYLARGAQGVLLPGPAAAIIETHVLRARRERSTPPPPPAAVPVVVLPAQKPLLAPPARPKATAVAPAPPVGSVSPDPSWVVASTSRTWKWIVLHHSDDTSGALEKYHQVHLGQGWEHGCGYHFVIGNGSQSADGEVEVSRRWLGQLHGAHAKTPDNLFNEHGIGICLVGDFEKGSGRPSAAQMRSLVRLTQWLMDRYGIAPANVRGHCHCKPTCCPGKNFPWAELRSKLRGPAGGTPAWCPPPSAALAAAGFPAKPGAAPKPALAPLGLAPSTETLGAPPTSAVRPPAAFPPAR